MQRHILHAVSTELGIRYFSPYSLFSLPLLQHLFSLSVLRYATFTKIAMGYSLFAIATFVSSVLRIASIFGLYLCDPQH
jgi:hypothetical protein